MTAIETAAVLGVSPASVYIAIRRGELTARETQRGVDIDKDSVRTLHKLLIARGLAHCRTVEEVEKLLSAFKDGD